jgi:hydrogenase maturation protein HypF
MEKNLASDTSSQSAAQTVRSSTGSIALQVRGRVQGVGFRPFIYRLATTLGLNGWVRNTGTGVDLVVSGDPSKIEQFVDGLTRDAPPLARIVSVSRSSDPDLPPEGFLILPSSPSPVSTDPGPDMAVCGACLAEIMDPVNRRYRYPFTNCTDCGPRYTLIRSLPYDRSRTSMAPFLQCMSCRTEYESPSSRRFHAEPNACPDCGPRLTVRINSGEAVETPDPLAILVRSIKDGAIAAIKGVGGFHLAVDATNRQAVEQLRARKRRPDKPLSIMVPNLASLRRIAHISRLEADSLSSSERPIVLLEKFPECDLLMDAVAPGLDRVGVLLPYTPLHYLIFHEWAGRPDGTEWLRAAVLPPLVMTSANLSGEPLITENNEALEKLSRIADLIVVHDREILARCDDSVVRHGEPSRTVFRRARGFAPSPVRLPDPGPPVLAVGANLKNTVCVTRGSDAFLSPHIGDLASTDTLIAFEDAIFRLLSVLEVTPEAVALDLHPDFPCSQWALDFARSRGIPAIPVAHHHAHAVSVMADRELEGDVLAFSLDGMGMGPDGMLWGGELLKANAARFDRIGHLAPLALPGGDSAARSPWKMAASVLHRLGRGDEIEKRFPGPGANLLMEMLEKRVYAPETTSAGRLFDAVAGLLGILKDATFDGQAAMMLESLARRHGPVPLPSDFCLSRDTSGHINLDLAPLLDRLADTDDPAHGASLFHGTLAEGLAAMALEASNALSMDRVVFSGGCFQNALLSGSLRSRLEREGLAVFEPVSVPPNDGGLSLGQALVARTVSLEET